MTDDITALLDSYLARNCTDCGKTLPSPGSQCSCGTFPPVTRAEAEALLSAPGNVARLRSEIAFSKAEKAMEAFEESAEDADRLAMAADLLDAESVLAGQYDEAVMAKKTADSELRKKSKLAAASAKLLEEATAVHKDAEKALETAVRTRLGPKAEHDAQVRVTEALPLLTKYGNASQDEQNALSAAQTTAEDAARVLADIKQAKLDLADITKNPGGPGVSPDRALLLARPLAKWIDELAEDHELEESLRADEYELAVSLLYQMSGAIGVLSIAEESAGAHLAAEAIAETLASPLLMPGIKMPTAGWAAR